MAKPLVNHLLKRSFCCTSVGRQLITFQSHDDFVKKVFVENDQPVIVGFHADWFEPCQKVMKMLEYEINPRHDMNLALVNISENIELAHTFDIQAVPAVLGIKDGLVVQRIIGNVDPEAISGLVKRLSQNLKEQNG